MQYYMDAIHFGVSYGMSGTVDEVELMVQHLSNTYSIFSQPRRGYICSEVHMHVYTLDHVMME